MQVRVLGPVQATHNGDLIALGGPRQRAVLALLVAFANRPVSSDRLIDEIWGEEPPPQARNSLQAMISNLRKALQPDERFSIERNGRSYQLVAPEDGIDALMFTNRIDSARRRLGTDLDAGIGELTSALELWQGTPYSDVDEAETLRSDAARLEELRLRALESRFEAELAAGRAADAVGELEQLVDLEPLREGLYRLLMEALVASRRQAEALRVAGRLRQTLAAELGIDPSPELVAYEQQVLDQTATPRETADRTVANPYRGLESFTEADTDRFFGRDRLTELLVDRMAEDVDGFRLLAVVGASGSGKSSVVRAGLVPALRRGAVPGSEDWVVLQMVPGSSPLRELEAAMLRVAVNPPATLLEQLARDELGLRDAAERILPDESELLVMIDQFEELFTTADPDEATQLMSVIAGAVNAEESRVRVVVTLRADFYDRPLGHPGLAPLLAKRLETVVAMAPDELAEAITGPAEQVGVSVEPGLVGAIVADATGQPGALPMVQYALTELFENRTDSTMSLERYREMGGVRGAIRQRAESLYAEYDTTDQNNVRRLMLQLVRLADGDEHTRRRVDHTLLTDDFGDELIDTLTAARLLAVDQDASTERSTVEVAHEALLREWPRFNEWIEENRDDLRTLRRLQNAAQDWEEADRSDDYLLVGGRLAGFEDWMGRSQMSLGLPEAELLDGSIAARHASEAAQRRRRRRFTTLIAAASASVLAIASVVVVNNLQDRDRQALEGARQLALAAAAAADSDPQLALLLGIEAVETNPIPATLETLHDAIAGQRIVSDLGISGGIAAFVDNMTVAKLEEDGTIGIYDVSTATPTKQDSLGHVGWIPVEYVDPELSTVFNNRPQIRVSGDGTIIAVGAVDGSLYVAHRDRLWEPWSESIGSAAPKVALSRDGQLVGANAWTDDGNEGFARGSVFAAATGERLWDLPSAGLEALAFTPGPRTRVVTVTRSDDVLRQLDAETGDAIGSTSQISGAFDFGLITASSRHAYIVRLGRAEGTVIEINLQNGSQRSLGTHREEVWDLEVDGAGAKVASAGKDGKVRIWATNEATELFVLPEPAVDVGLSPDGSRLVTVDAEGMTLVWDTSPAGRAEVYSRVPDSLYGNLWQNVLAWFRPNSSELVQFVTDATGLATVSDVDESSEATIVTQVSNAADLSTDGRTLALGRRGVINLYDLDDGSRASFGTNRDAEPLDIAISPNGRFVAATWDGHTTDRTLEIFDIETGNVGLMKVDLGGKVAFDAAQRLHLIPSSGDVTIWELDGQGGLAEAGAGYNVGQNPSAVHVGELVFVADRTGLWSAVDPARGEVVLGSGLPHRAAIRSIAVDQDAGIFATGSLDGVIRLWDLETGDHLYRVGRLRWPIDSLSFRDGATELAAGTSGLVIVYALDADELIEIARQGTLRSLTAAECTLYLNDKDCD